MDELFRILETEPAVGRGFSLDATVLSLLLAFLLGQALAWVYYATHAGLSYSRSYVQSLILITVVVSMVMSAIANSIVTAVGLMGALAIIRFRNMIKDTRDIAFIFSALVAGMTCGAQRYGTAIIGTGFVIGVALYLHWTGFGSHQPHNGFLQLQLATAEDLQGRVPSILKRFCSSFTLLSAQNEGTGPGHYAYQVMLRDVARNGELLAELQAVPGLAEVNLTMQEQLLEA